MSQRVRSALPLIASLLLVAVWLSPVLHTGFRFDDTFNFEMRTGVFAAQGTDFGEYFGDQLTELFSTGRAQPLGIALSVIPWTFSDAPTAYKAFLIALTLAALLAMYLVVRMLGVPRRVGLLAIVLTGAFVQLRAYHDPLLGYIGLAQLCLLLFLGSVYAWLRHDTSGRRGPLIVAFGLWVCCLMLYEVSFALAPAYLAVIACRRGSPATFLRASLPIMAPVLAGAGVLVAQRLTDDTAGAYYQPGGGVGAMLETWGVLIVGAVPATYAAFDPAHLMGSPTAAELLAASWRGVAAVAAVVIAASVPVRGALLRGPALLGGALWIFASAPIAVSPKYQDELSLGMAYIPGFMQVAGIGVLVACAIIALSTRAAARGVTARRATVAVMALVVGGAAGATALANMRVVGDEQPTRATRNVLNDALRHGVLRVVPVDGTVVAFARDLRWYPTSYETSKVAFDGVVADRSGRRLDMRVDSKLPARPCRRPLARWPRRPCEAVGAAGGWLAVRPRPHGDAVVSFATSPRGQVADSAAETRAFAVYQAGTVAGSEPILRGRLPAGDAPWSSQGTVSWRRVAGESGWSLWRGTLKPGQPAPIVSAVDPGGPIDFTVPAAAAQRVRWLGTRMLLP